MSFITESQLKGFSQSSSFSLNESLRQVRNESKSNKITIFLSHKHDELESLSGSISFLKKEGIDVYIDWLDEGMPKTTSGETAKRIKQKIKENDKFILLASEGAINSKWCNWELGLGDAAKYIENIALLPIQKDNSIYPGAEYLQIYPYIEYQNGYNRYKTGELIAKGYYVRHPNNVITPLRTWLGRK